MFDDLIHFAHGLRDSELLAATQVLASYETLASSERSQLLEHLTQELERRAERPLQSPLTPAAVTA